MLDAPIRLQGKTVGVVCHEHIGPKRSWTVEEEEFAKSISDLCAVVLASDERKKAEQAIFESEKRYRILVENSPYCIHEMNRDGSISFINPTGLRMLGVNDIGEVLGKLFLDIVCDEDHERIEKLMKHAYEGQASEFVFTTKSNTMHQSCFIPISNQAGEITKLMGISQDVTERIHREKELRKTIKEAKENRDRLVHVVRVHTLGEMASGIAHEINQPLAAIVSYAQASLRYLQPEKVDGNKIGELIGKIIIQSKRAGSIVSHLRAMMQDKSSVPILLDINNILKDVKEIAETDTKVNNCQLSFNLSHSLPKIICDEIQIQQVLINLIHNAVDAMAGNAEGKEKNIVVETNYNDSNFIEVSITDSGPGINVGDDINVFDSFYTTKKSGLGLGLPICKTIIEEHGGEIGFMPNNLGGTTFFFTLPIDKKEN